MEVLDHGYVELKRVDGAESDIIEAARMSTSKGFLGWDDVYKCQECSVSHCIDVGTCKACGGGLRFRKGDKHLLSYLYTHKHMTPFEMVGMVIEVQAPIFVMREWHRHRTMSYNELSARYTPLPDLFYIPSIERLMNGKQSTSNKQGSNTGFDIETANGIRESIEEGVRLARDRYTSLLDYGVAREISRLVVPVGQYSRMRASTNLRNWLQFLTLRLGEGVQWEMKQYAEAVGQLISESFPRSWALFNEERG